VPALAVFTSQFQTCHIHMLVALQTDKLSRATAALTFPL
jgi:hypothetical protein